MMFPNRSDPVKHKISMSMNIMKLWTRISSDSETNYFKLYDCLANSRDSLIIAIDGFYHGRILLTGKKRSMQQLQQMYSQAKKLPHELNDFPDLFCRLYHFDRIPFEDDITVDFVLDIDTGRIYSPSYGHS